MIYLIRCLSRRHFIGCCLAMMAALTCVSASAETTSTVSVVDFGSSPTSTHRVVTANILLASSAHKGTPAEWDQRKDLCITILKKQNADIICMQEVLRGQAQDVGEAMPEYASYGFAGPEMDAHADNDYHGVTKNVILYRKDRYDFVASNCYWLSETPLIAGSVSWDALRGRHVNWLRLKDRETGKHFRILDTHFDHKGKQARVEQAKMIVQESAQYAQEFPQILCGDLNADLNNPALKELISNGWIDTWTAVHGDKDSGRTFHGLKGPAYVTKSTNGRIDFVLIRGNVKTRSANIITDHNNGQYPSDHYFVSAEVEL